MRKGKNSSWFMKLMTRFLTISQLFPPSSCRSNTTVSSPLGSRSVSTFTAEGSESHLVQLRHLSQSFKIKMQLFVPLHLVFTLHSERNEWVSLTWLLLTLCICKYLCYILTHERSPSICVWTMFKKSSNFVESQGTTASSKRPAISTRAWMTNRICFSVWEE